MTHVDPDVLNQNTREEKKEQKVKNRSGRRFPKTG